MKKNDVVEYLVVLSTGATIGAYAGLKLSFTALSPLIIGGIVGSIAPALFTVMLAENMLCQSCKIKDEEKNLFFSCCVNTLASAAIGVGLAAAAMAIFPGVTLGMGSAALAGAIIGVIVPIAAAYAIVATVFAAQKVNDYIISPVVEKVGKCFSSKEEENGLVKG
ncbi:hypothetical protein BBB02_01910 [Wolbachia endosymbiont of Bemisia tabaci]|uniref:hypothetical protein n=1 Tax=Wolbachia endosymbiont of Bemisia tabaci TaxID=215173 RepID=UPI000FD18546|nr:hypothetical protein [Wolbachia endosymbiont of Bemisia tabaci]AZU37346.1 hypothetical protein BBB02_01910 [Wolbachia endosymbiont of Bemisia tabaci]